MASYCIRCQDKEVNWEDMLCPECQAFENLKIKHCFNCGKNATKNFWVCSYHDIHIGVCSDDQCRNKGRVIMCHCDLS